MRRLLKQTRIFAVLALLLTLALTATPTLADSPHFIRADASVTNQGNLEVTFKEAGLGDNPVTIAVSADATAVYACINGGGKHPKAANKETFAAKVGNQGTFGPSKNGQVNGTLFVFPPNPTNFSCPSGQTLVLASVSYTNVVVTDITNGVSINVPGTFSKTFFNI